MEILMVDIQIGVLVNQVKVHREANLVCTFGEGILRGPDLLVAAVVGMIFLARFHNLYFHLFVRHQQNTPALNPLQHLLIQLHNRHDNLLRILAHNPVHHQVHRHTNQLGNHLDNHF